MRTLNQLVAQSDIAFGESIRRLNRAPLDSQRDYRKLIEVLGRPGTIAQIDTVEAIPPVLSLASGLADVDVTVAVLDEDWERPFIVATGATVASAERAQHVLATRPLTAEQVRTLERGDALHPEHGARVFAAVAAFEAGVRLTLSGPGIVGETTLAVDGLDKEVFEALAEANADFPSGVDLILVAPDGRMAAIPRSTRLTIAGES